MQPPNPRIPSREPDDPTSPTSVAPASRTVVVPVYDGVDLVDVAGPVEVFTIADRLLGGGRYEVVVAAASVGEVQTFGGVPVLARTDFAGLPARIDTLLVPGGATIGGRSITPVVDEAVVDVVRQHAGRARRVASVCSGAHVLGAAGLLDGRRATTHWATAATLQRDHPDTDVDADAIFVRDGHVWTSAGLTAGMDLTLALVAQDHGDAVARAVARWMVVYLRRPGGQSQYSAPLARQSVSDGPIADLLRWLVEHLDEDLSVPALADRVALSPRHFSRLFAQETGCTPAEHVARLRLEEARRLLEQTAETLPVIARRCGYGSVDGLQRAFRAAGTTPARHRAQFRSVAPTVAPASAEAVHA